MPGAGPDVAWPDMAGPDPDVARPDMAGPDPGRGAFEESTPADAQMNPCRVSAITSGGRTRTISTDSRRIASTRRGSRSPASSRARADGSMSSRRTTRPSAFDTTFCASTTMSSSSSSTAPATRPPRSSPSPTSGIPTSGMTRTSVNSGEADACVRPVFPVDIENHRGHSLERRRDAEPAGVDRSSGDDELSKLERKLLRFFVATADESVLVRLLARQFPCGERMEPGCHRHVDDLCRSLCEGTALQPRKGLSAGEVELTRNRKEWRPEQVAQSMCGREHGSGDDRKNDEIHATESRLVPQADATDFRRHVACALGVPRSDHDLDALCHEPRGETASERARPSDDGDPHATAIASSATPANLRRESASDISVRVTTGRTPSAATASTCSESALSNTSASTN